MDLSTLTRFFLWCTIIDGALFALGTVVFIAAPEMVYRTQTKWFRIPRENFDTLFYSFLGLFKLGFLFLNLVPYIALRIVGG